MSAPPTDPPVEQPTEKKKGLKKYISRIKSVLKGEPSKRNSTIIVPTPEVAPVHDPTTESHSALPPASSPFLTPVDRSQAAYDRARDLAKKYNLEFDTSNWKVTPTGDRVHKQIRVRIHRSCHLCRTTFGVDKVCISCGHSRCGECTRYPATKVPKEEGDGSGKGKAIAIPSPFAPRIIPVIAAASDADIPPVPRNKKEKYILTIPSKTGGQDLVRKKPRQRVRRTCHKCSVVFQSTSKTCTGCSHVRCTECPREPAKKNKYPHGYPGDAIATPNSSSSNLVYKKPFRVVRYNCHECNKTFGSGESFCQKCGHEKCSECVEGPPKELPKQDLDPLQSVKDKVHAIASGNSSGSTAVQPGDASVPASEEQPKEGLMPKV